MNFKDYLNELKTHTPYDFSDYSDNSIHRRIQKILKDEDLTIEELVRKTREDQCFVEHVVEEITVNTTELFRDPEIWISFYEKAYPIFNELKKLQKTLVGQEELLRAKNQMKFRFLATLTTHEGLANFLGRMEMRQGIEIILPARNLRCTRQRCPNRR